MRHGHSTIGFSNKHLKVFLQQLTKYYTHHCESFKFESFKNTNRKFQL